MSDSSNSFVQVSIPTPDGGCSVGWVEETDDGFSVRCPKCSAKAQCVGGCSEGCCSDYECPSCSRRWRIEYPD